jgi:hypothetical protein
MSNEGIKQKAITPELLHRTICTLRERWVQRGDVKAIHEINRAWCFSFAEEVADILYHEEGISEEQLLGDRGNLGDQNVLYYLSNEDFQIIFDENRNEIPCFVDEDGIRYFAWNVSLLEKWNIHPPQGMTWEEANQIPFGYHVFLVFNNRFFDAECPKGVDSFFDLPLYKETLQEYLNNKNKKQ